MFNKILKSIKKEIIFFKPLLIFFDKYRSRYVINIFLSFVITLIQIAATVFIDFIFQVVSKDFELGGGLKSMFDFLHVKLTPEPLILFVIIFFILTSSRLIFGYLNDWLLQTSFLDVKSRLRMHLFDHLQKLPLFSFKSMKSGNLMLRFTDDICCVDDFQIMFFDMLNLFITIPITLIYLIHIGKELTLYVFIPLILVTFVSYKFSNTIKKKSQKAQESFGNLTSKLQENLSGIKVIKSYVNENNEIAHFQEINEDFFSQNVQLQQTTNLMDKLIVFLLDVYTLIFIGLGSYFIIIGKLTPSLFAAFLYQLLFLAIPIKGLGKTSSVYQRARVRFGRIKSLLDNKTEAEQIDKTNKTITTISGQITFKNLTFSFTHNKPILRNIDISFPQGKNICLVGDIGSGKSTLLYLLSGLYKSPPKSIYIDQYPLEEIPPHILKKNIAYVPEESFLFSGRIKENISFGSPIVNKYALEKAASIADVQKDIDSFPEGYDTMIGQKGVTLSEGQKQRIAIARAIITQPKILILDNSLSHMDANTEKNILENIIKEFKKSTIIYVSNRIYPITYADLIVILYEGHILEWGSHEELIKNKGFYSTFYEREMMEASLTKYSL